LRSVRSAARLLEQQQANTPEQHLAKANARHSDKDQLIEPKRISCGARLKPNDAGRASARHHLFEQSQYGEAFPLLKLAADGQRQTCRSSSSAT